MTHHPDDRGVADERPGLAFERTYVAWQRTGLAFGAVGILFLHAARGPRHPWGLLPGLFGLALGVAIAALGALRYQPDPEVGPVRTAGPGPDGGEDGGGDGDAGQGPDHPAPRPLVGLRGPAALVAVAGGAVLLAIGGLALIAAG